MDTIQISCTLKDVKSFVGVFPSDKLPRSITQTSTVIVNEDAHTQSGSHCLAIRLEPRSSTAFYFDSYGLPPNIHEIQTVLRRNCTVLYYNTIELQGPLSLVCGEYCCLFALYMDRGYTGKQFAGLFTPGVAEQQVEKFLAPEFGSVHGVCRGDLCCNRTYKRWVPTPSYLIYNLNADRNGSCYRLRILIRGTRRGSAQGSFRGGQKCPVNIEFPSSLHHRAPWLKIFVD